MPKLSIKAGATSQSVNVFISNSSSTTGAGLTGLAYNTSGLTAYYSFSGAGATSTAITLASLATVTTAYASGGFVQIDGTNMPGWYRFDLPNAVLAAGSGRSVGVHLQGAANMAPLPVEIELTGWDNQDAVHGGLSSLPNTACTTNASLLTSGTGTDQLSVATGTVNVGKVNGVSAGAVTTVSAVLGTTTALTFDANNYVKVDLVDIAGTAVSAAAAQLGVNVVNVAGTASAGAAGYVGIDWGHVNAPTTAVALTGTTVGTATTVTNTVAANVTQFGGVTGTYSGGVPAVNTVQWSGITAGYTGSNNLVRLYDYVGSLTHQLVTDSNGYVTFNNTALATVTTVTNQLTAAAIATGVWQDTTAGDFTVAGSIGKSLAPATLGTAPGAAGGLALVGSNVGTASSVTGSVGSITGVAFPTNFATLSINGSGYVTYANAAPPTTAQIATAVWQDATAGDFTVSGSIGKGLFTSGTAPGAASGLALVGSNVGTASSVTGSVGSVTGSVGSVSGVTFPTNFAALSINGSGYVTYANTAPPTAAAVASSVWATPVPGSFTSGQAGYVLGNVATGTPPTAAAIATAVWTDTTAGDFTTASSPGKVLVAQLGGAFTSASSAVFSAAALANAPSGGGGGPTAAQIATAVWQDATAGDFTVTGSIGKGLFTSGNVPGAASGLALVGSNVGAASSVTGSVGSISGVAFPTNFATLAITGSGYVTFANTAIATVTTVTNQLTAAAIATGVWQDATAGDFAAAGSIGKSLAPATLGTIPGAAGGHALVGSNVGTASSVTGSVGSITGVAFPTNFAALAINGSGYVTYANAAPPAAAAVATAVWQDLTAGGDFGTAGSIGALLKADINAPIGAIPTNPYTGTPPTAAQIATAVWQDATAGDFTVGGSAGRVLVAQLGGAFTSAASSVFSVAALANAPSGGGGGGDPWATPLPGAYAAGTAGSILGTYLDTRVSSRLAGTAAPANFGALGITVAGKVAGVALVDALTTYTNNVPQSGDAYGAVVSGAFATALATTLAPLVAAAVLAAPALALTPGPAVVNAAGAPVAAVGLGDAVGALVVGLLGARSGIGTQEVTATVPGAPGTQIQSTRTGPATSQSVITVPGGT